MTREARMEALAQNGIDTSKFFDMMHGVSSDHVSDDMAAQIMENGYIANSHLFRRWVMAHYIRMYRAAKTCHMLIVDYAAEKYGNYDYMLKTMCNELRVLSILKTADRDYYEERKQFFDYNIVTRIVKDYVHDVSAYIKKRAIRKDDGGIRICKKTYNSVEEILTPLFKLYTELLRCDEEDYSNMYRIVYTIKEHTLPIGAYKRADRVGITKSYAWAHTFCEEGAYYTLINLAKFHGVGIEGNAPGEASVKFLRDKLDNRHMQLDLVRFVDIASGVLLRHNMTNIQ